MMPQPAAPPSRDIWTAARRGDVDLLRTLIEEEKNDVNEGDEDGSTPLHWAAYFDRLEAINYLLQRGANIDAPNTKESQTPLHWACIGKSLKSMLLLIQEGADTSKSDKRGYDCLVHACQYGNVLMAHNLIVKQGFSVSHRDAEGHTPLHWAAYQNHETVARLLLSLGADIRSVDNEGLTPMHWASLKGHFQMVQFLILNGGEVQAVDADGYTPLDLATQKNMKNTVSLLRYSQGYTPETEARNWRTWFFLPWFLVPLFFFLIDALPFYALVVVMAALFIVIKKLITFMWLGKDTNNPFFMSVMAAAYALSTWVYFIRIFPVTNEYTLLTMFFIGVNVMWAFLFLYMVRSNPGHLKRDEDGVEKIYQKLNHGAKKIPELCPTCMIARPLRAKHCRSCNRCVARMDHHCAWLNNCVGVNNHQPFMVLLTLVILLHCIFAFFCIQVLGALDNAPSFWPPHEAIYFYYNKESMLIMLVSFHLFNALWEMYVFYQQWTLIFDNLTANEFINGTKYTYFRDRENRFRNPFDKGWKANLQDFLHPKIDYTDLYELPYTDDTV